jgi:hypothetical protein
MERVTVLGEIDILVDGSITHVLKPDPLSGPSLPRRS